MSSGNKAIPSSFAFYTVVEDEIAGYFGGYLALNEQGRPLEFHCTAPVQPTRAQRILYGATLSGYLIGEQIGVALHAKTKSQTQAVLTDIPAGFDLDGRIDAPVGLVSKEIPRDLIGDKLAFREWSILCRSGQSMKMDSLLQELTDSLDLFEPFARIREAIAEAKKATKPDAANRAAA